MRKNLLALIALLVISFAGLTGCGGGSSSIVPTTPMPSLQQGEGPPPPDIVEADIMEEADAMTAWEEERRLQEELATARVFSVKPGDNVQFTAPEGVGEEHEGSTSWNLTEVSQSAGLIGGFVNVTIPWSQTLSWAYPVSSNQADGRYEVAFSAINQDSGRPLTFSIVIDVKATGHELPFQVYPASRRLTCPSGVARINLDGFFPRGYYTEGQVSVIDPSTTMPTNAWWMEQDKVGTEIEISTYWLGEQDLHSVWIKVNYLDENDQVQSTTQTFEVADSCHFTGGSYYYRKGSGGDTPVPGVQRPINR